jgi:hypothetical protein
MQSEISFFGADESTWSNNVHRGEAGQSAAWLCAELEGKTVAELLEVRTTYSSQVLP